MRRFIRRSSLAPLVNGILGHESNVDIGALHVDGGGVSDIVFAIAALLGRSFEPRIPRLSDRKLYAFEPKTDMAVWRRCLDTGSTLT